MDENLYYKGINKSNVDPYRLSQQYDEDPEHPRPQATKAHEPPYLFKSGETLLAMTEKYNVRVIHYGVIPLILPQMTIAQLVYENERHYLTDEEIHEKVRMPSPLSTERAHQVVFPSAKEDLASDGRMHTNGCIDHGEDPSRSVEPPPTCTNAVPAPYARVRGGPPPSPSSLIPRVHRFYPGIHPSSSLSIGPGSSTSAINVPAVNVNLPNEKSDSLSNGNGNGNGNGNANANEAEKVVNRGPKATRVVGSFDHPLLPMAPVSLVKHTRGFRLLKVLQKRTVFPAIDFLSCYAIAVNEVKGQITLLRVAAKVEFRSMLVGAVLLPLRLTARLGSSLRWVLPFLTFRAFLNPIFQVLKYIIEV